MKTMVFSIEDKGITQTASYHLLWEYGGYEIVSSNCCQKASELVRFIILSAIRRMSR